MLNPRIQMRLVKFLQCNKNLDFKPQKKWPSHLPAVAVKHGSECLIVAGFESELEMVVEVEANLPTVFKDCYGELTLPEFARLYCLVKKNNLEFSWSDFVMMYKLKWTTDFEKMLIVLSQTPASFQEWVSSKSLGAQELSALTWHYLSEKENVDMILSKFNSQTNKSFGVKILEWSIELLAQKVAVETLLSQSDDAEEWHNSLYNLRFKRTANEDRKWQDRIFEVPWPRQVHAQWKREGDQAAVEIKFSALNAQDFENKTNQISNLKTKISELWNRS